MFRTTFKIPQNKQQINYKGKILMLGSCFSENIGTKLEKHKFSTCLNPFGILFNPLSIGNAINKLVQNQKFNENDLLHFDGKYLSLQHHSRFTFETASETLSHINEAINQGHGALKEAQTIILTLGTAYYYYHKEQEIPVANCHKIPQNAFEKRFLNVNQAVDSLTQTFSNIQRINPNANMILTLSPVRHWKDGVQENQKSKASLYLAIQEMVEAEEQVSYFPAYELVLDDLRDYRFYKPDMLHPNDTAIDYIWEKFQEAYFSKETIEQAQEIHKIQKSIHHRPRFPDSQQHQNFLMGLLRDLESLEGNQPILDFQEEKRLIRQKMKNRKRKDF